MLTRWFSQVPLRLRTLSPSAQRPNGPNDSFSLLQNLAPCACSSPQAQRRQQHSRKKVVEEVGPNADERRVHKSVSWSVNRNNLRVLKAALSDVDQGALSEVEFLEELAKRIPDLPTALALDDKREERGRGGTATSASFTHDGGLGIGRGVATEQFGVVHRESVKICSASSVDGTFGRVAPELPEPLEPPDPLVSPYSVELEDVPGREDFDGTSLPLQQQKQQHQPIEGKKQRLNERQRQCQSETGEEQQPEQNRADFFDVAKNRTKMKTKKVREKEVAKTPASVGEREKKKGNAANIEQVEIDAVLSKVQQEYVKEYQRRRKMKRQSEDRIVEEGTVTSADLLDDGTAESLGNVLTSTNKTESDGAKKKKKSKKESEADDKRWGLEPAESNALKKKKKSKKKLAADGDKSSSEQSESDMTEKKKKNSKKAAADGDKSSSEQSESDVMKKKNSKKVAADGNEKIYFSTSPLLSESSLQLDDDVEDNNDCAAVCDEEEDDVGSSGISSSRQPYDIDTAFAFELDGSVKRSAELASYLQTCVWTGHLSHAEAVMMKNPIENAVLIRDAAIERILLQRRSGVTKPLSYLGNERTAYKYFANLTVSFNILLQAFLENDSLGKFDDFLRKMVSANVEMDAQTISLILIARERYRSQREAVPPTVELVATRALEEDGQRFPIDSMLKLPARLRSELKAALSKIEGFGGVEAIVDTNCPRYVQEIVEELNEKRESYPNPYYGAFDREEIKAKLADAIAWEKKGRVTIPPVVNADSTSTSEDLANDASSASSESTSRLGRHRQMWSRTLTNNLSRELERLKRSKYDNADISIWLYLNLFSLEELVSLMMEEVESMAQSIGGHYLPLSMKSKSLGRKMANMARAKMHPFSDVATFENVYDKYLDFLCAETRPYPTERLFFESLKEDYPVLIDLERFDYHWPVSVITDIGNLLMDIITGEIMFEVGGVKGNPYEKNLMPIFYKTLVKGGFMGRIGYDIKVHPGACLLFKDQPTNPQSFEVTEVPMTVPPLPWVGLVSGGNLLQANDAVRSYGGNRINADYCKRTPTERLSPIFDSLNHLGNCPWRVNGFMLDVATQVFTSGGNPKLALPPPSEFFAQQLEGLPRLTPDLSGAERLHILKARKTLTKSKIESYSLWCTQSYKLSIASHLRDSVLWYPINMDFRSRVYPIPPHLNHMGDDLVRGLLHFAKAKSLGPKGLDWLKIHVINLTGLKKRDSVANRLVYADEVLDDIIDSARHPLCGKRWWMDSDEPWETLAVCKDIADALDHPDGAENYRSHLPIHQDGSCNGLQHYAALGRDLAGGRSVNLCQSEFPQDVYSDVLELVIEKINRDANSGSEVARQLQGVVTRKVIKQTVMTTVYGVTQHGARRQVENRLKEVGFPRENVWQCSMYLSSATLQCLDEMFVATKKIQDWFNDIAVLISRTFEKPVSWETPLGLPVLQPYFKEKHRDKLKASIAKKRKPDSMKQKNGFAPNFIHSLDATHMMLTALHAYRRGICFNAVHDCFWTHAADVDEMNAICRQEFVKLHSLPHLGDLARHVQRSAPPENELTGTSRKTRLLSEVAQAVPERGELDIKDVLGSVYFFS